MFLNESNIGVMEQFYSDNQESKQTTINAARIKSIVNKYSVSVIKEGDVLVDVGLSVKGGHFNYYKTKKLGEINSWEKYGDRIDLDGAINQNILIEHPEYKSKNIEPYNRQGIFYIGTGFNNLNLTTIDGWNIYNSEKRTTNCNMPTEEFDYNDFWQTVDFIVGVRFEELPNFIMELFGVLEYNESIVKHVLSLV